MMRFVNLNHDSCEFWILKVISEICGLLRENDPRACGCGMSWRGLGNRGDPELGRKNPRDPILVRHTLGRLALSSIESRINIGTTGRSESPHSDGIYFWSVSLQFAKLNNRHGVSYRH